MVTLEREVRLRSKNLSAGVRETGLEKKQKNPEILSVPVLKKCMVSKLAQEYE